MAYLGKNTLGDSDVWMSANNFRGYKITATESGSVDKASFAFKEDYSGDLLVKAVLMNANSGKILAISDPVTISGNTYAWYDFYFSTRQNIVNGQTYLVDFIVNAGSSNLAISATASAGNFFYSTTGANYATPGDWGASYNASNAVDVSGYLTYTPMATQTLTYATAGTYNWICPAGVYYVRVKGWAGGGSGSGCTTQGTGGGGQGGAYAESLVAVTPGTTYQIVVAAVKTGTTAAGAAGNDTTFATSIVVAKGGAGGTNSAGGNTDNAASSTGDIKYKGGTGAPPNGTTSSGAGGGGAGDTGAGNNANTTTAGAAKANNGGAGGAGRTTAGNGAAGSAAGGGGGGAWRASTTNQSGGNGAQGRMEIVYAIPKASSIKDSFNDNSVDATKWHNGHPTDNLEQNGRLEMTLPAHTQYDARFFGTLDKYDLTGDTYSIKVVDLIGMTGYQIAFPIKMSKDASNYMQLYIDASGWMGFQAIINDNWYDGGGMGYDPDVHVYVRLRESGGTVYAEYSTDGINDWTAIGSYAVTFDKTFLTISSQVTSDSDDANTFTMIVDNVNITPGDQIQSASKKSVTDTVSATLTSTPEQGDLLVAAVYSSEGKATVAMSGWTLAANQDDDILHSLSIFYKIAGAGESTTVTATSTGAGSMHIAVSEFYKCAASDILDKTAAATSGAATVIVQSTGTTPTTSDANEVLVCAAGIAGTAASPSYTNEFVNIANTTKVQMGWKKVTATGAYETTIGYTGTAALMNSILVTFRIETPAGGTTTQTTIDGKARIIKTIAQTLTGVARIIKTTTQTLTGQSRIIHTTQTTSTGISRIQKTTPATLTGIARIQRTTQQTLGGIARIVKSTSQTITGQARIRRTTQQTLDGKARIQKTQQTTLDGKASIASPTKQTTLTGLARIQRTTQATLEGLARIMRTTAATQPGIARIRRTTAATITAVSRIRKSVTADSTGKARIQRTTPAQITGTARISKSVTQTLQGLSRIVKSTSQTLEGKARIEKTGHTDQPGTSRIQKTRGESIDGRARIELATNTTQTSETGRARIQKTQAATQDGRARLQKTIETTQEGMARIVKQIQTTIQSVARLQISRQETQEGKGRIEVATQAHITSQGRIEALKQETLTGKANIEATTQTQITGKARISKMRPGAASLILRTRNHEAILSSLADEVVTITTKAKLGLTARIGKIIIGTVKRDKTVL